MKQSSFDENFLTSALIPIPTGPGADVLPPDDKNPALVYLAGLGDSSRRPMQSALRVVARILRGRPIEPKACRWDLVRYQHAQAVRAALAERFLPATANRLLTALRCVLKECWRLGLMTGEEYTRAVDLKPIPGQRLPAGREVTIGDIARVLDSCTHGHQARGARDAALVVLLYGCGLRRAEMVALDLADYDPASGELLVRAGKGRKERNSYVPSKGRPLIARWVDLRGPQPGPLLCPVKKGGRIDFRRMSAHNVHHLAGRLALQAKVAKFSPHDLRRSFVSHLLEAGADLVVVRDLAGHANVNTTARYDRRGERSKRRAAELLDIPIATG